MIPILSSFFEFCDTKLWLLVVVDWKSLRLKDEKMTQVNLQKIRTLRQQIIAETNHGFADWNLVQQLLDDLMIHHQKYKYFAKKENIALYK